MSIKSILNRAKSQFQEISIHELYFKMMYTCLVDSLMEYRQINFGNLNDQRFNGLYFLIPKFLI